MTFIRIDGEQIPDVGPGTLESRIKKAADLRSVPVLCNVFTPIYNKETNDLCWLEKTLRKLDTTVYVLAAPKWVFPPGMISVDPHGGPKPYFLWFAVNGIKEAEDTIQKFGLAKDYDENFKLLKDDVGFATAP